MWFRRAKKVEPPDEVDDGAHSVAIHYALADRFGTEEQREAVFALEDRLEEALDIAEAGVLDGHEFGEGEAVVYLYGSDKDRMWAALQPVAAAFPYRPAYALLIGDGDPGLEPVRIDL